jgi:hypothetical protein
VKLPEYFPFAVGDVATVGLFPEFLNPPRLPDSKPLLYVSVAAFNGEIEVKKNIITKKRIPLCLSREFNESMIIMTPKN